MTDKYPYTKTIQRAIRQFKEHKLTIEHDDGVFRSLLFKQPSTINYHFRLVTWPGHLAFSGDIGDYVFAREYDMFGWFASDKDWAAMPLQINPQYWGEKVQATYKGSVGESSNGVVDRGTDVRAVRADLVRWFREVDDWAMRDSDGETYRKGAWTDLRHYLLERLYPDMTLNEVIGMVNRFSLPGYMFLAPSLRDRSFETGYDHYEGWTSREPNPTFLMCCAAIVWGIKRYAQVKEGRTSEAFMGRVLRGES